MIKCDISLMILFLLSSYISDAISERDYDKKKLMKKVF